MGDSLDTLVNWYLKEWGWGILAAVVGGIFILVFLDNQRRRLNAAVWLLVFFLCLLTFIPGAIYAISSAETRETIDEYRIVIFYVGMLGAMMPPLLLIGYWQAHRGLPLPPPPTPPQPSVIVPSVSPYDDAVPTVIEFPPAASPAMAEPPASPLPERDLTSAWLVDVDHPDLSYRLRKDKTEIGRGQSNDYALPDDTVSRRHILIRYENGQFFLQDVGSAYGTLLNNIALESKEPLTDGDIITIGNTRLRFVDGGDL